MSDPHFHLHTGSSGDPLVGALPQRLSHHGTRSHHPRPRDPVQRNTASQYISLPKPKWLLLLKAFQNVVLMTLVGLTIFIATYYVNGFLGDNDNPDKPYKNIVYVVVAVCIAVFAMGYYFAVSLFDTWYDFAPNPYYIAPPMADGTLPPHVQAAKRHRQQLQSVQIDPGDDGGEPPPRQKQQLLPLARSSSRSDTRMMDYFNRTDG